MTEDTSSYRLEPGIPAKPQVDVGSGMESLFGALW